MKVNISFEPTTLNGYENQHLLNTPNGFALEKFDNGELDEILASDIVEYLPRQVFDKILHHWTTKLAHKGKLIIDFADLYTVCRLFFLGQLDMQNVNVLLHGPQDKEWNLKKVNLTIPQIAKTLESMGLKILSSNLDGVKATIIAERP